MTGDQLHLIAAAIIVGAVLIELLAQMLERPSAKPKGASPGSIPLAETAASAGGSVNALPVAPSASSLKPPASSLPWHVWVRLPSLNPKLEYWEHHRFRNLVDAFDFMHERRLCGLTARLSTLRTLPPRHGTGDVPLLDGQQFQEAVQ